MPNPPTTLLACDPGTKSFGLACLSVTHNPKAILRNQLKFKVLENGLVLAAMKSGKSDDFNKGLIAFDRFMMEKIRKYRPYRVVGERFINRGGLAGTSSELIGYMIGNLHLRARMAGVRSFIMIQASQWKSALGRYGVVLDEWYAALVDMSVPPRERLTRHQIDATLIGIYCSHRAAGLKGYECLPELKVFGKMLNASKILPPVKERKKPVRGKKPKPLKRKRAASLRTGRAV